MLTVEADSAHVESRLATGEIACPACPDGILAGWGHARARTIAGTAGIIRPRRARCRACRATHVLLPVILLLRRAYTAEIILAALAAKARGHGHRPIAADLAAPAETVRGWLRRFTSRARLVRDWFMRVTVDTGIDPVIPDTAGGLLADALAAIGAAAAAIRGRFGPGAAAGIAAVTTVSVAVASSNSRLLSPGWPGMPAAPGATRVDPAAAATV